jgi:hypothetical protein
LKKRSKKLLILGVRFATAFALTFPPLLAKTQPLQKGTSAVVVALAGQSLTMTPGNDADVPVAKLCLTSHCFTVPAGRAFDEHGAVPAIQSVISVRDGYLFVRSDNGGNGWRSVIATVFAIRNAGLVRLGAIAADDFPVPLAQQPNQGGVFFDIDNQLEENRITSHADAPGVAVALQERDGKFVYDPAWCWRLNAADYARQTERLKLPGQIPYYDMAVTLLNMAVIDKYCARTQALEADLFHAKARLPDETYKMMASILDSLQVGKRPADPFRETGQE